MPNLNTEEVVSILDGAGVVVTDLKVALKKALEDLAPLVAENASLEAANAVLVAADASVDEAAAKLKAVLDGATAEPPVDPPVDPPVEDPVVVDPPVEG